MASPTETAESVRLPGLQGRRRRPTFWRRNRRTVVGGGTLLLFLAAWQVVAVSGWVKPIFLSSPVAVVHAFVHEATSGILARDLAVSGWEFLIGFGLAIVVGVLVGVVIGWFPLVDEALDPLISAFYATPRVALVPLIIIWFGIGLASKVVLIFSVAVFPIIVNTAAGFRGVDAHLVEVSQSFGARQAQIFVNVGLPSAVPFILTGLRLGVGMALIGIAVGEAFGATAGVGYRIFIAGSVFRTDQMFVGLIILAVAGMIFSEVVRKIERRFDVWRPDSK